MSQIQSTPTGVTRVHSKESIVLDKISNTGAFQKPGTLTAQIRQKVITKSSYPSKKVESDMQETLFSTSDFGFKTQDFESVENRVAFILVPTGTTPETMSQKLAAANSAGATIYRVLSNEPILDENQKYAIEAGLRTKADFANTQVVRYPKGHQEEGKILLDKAGNVQYRRTFFWKTAQEDVDVRGESAVYMSPEIEAELSGASVLAGQTI